MKIGHFEVFVRNPQTARDFYRDVLGFEVTVEQDPGLVWLEKDGLEILLRRGTPAPLTARYEQARVGTVLYTDDLEATRMALEARGLEFRGTVDTENA